MSKTKEIIDDVTMKRAITRITYEIIERNKGNTARKAICTIS